MQEMHQHYNILLVALSYAVSALGAYTALQLALGIPLAQSNGRRLAEVVAAGTAMGGGAIWAMHFIAMLACDIGAPFQFDAIYTAASALLAAASCSLGLWIVATRGTGFASLLSAGTLMGG